MGDTELEKPCESCPKRSRCTKPCERVERILSNDETGKTWREKPWEFSRGNPKGEALWGLTDDAELYRLFWYSWDKLTARQREALMLREREHMSFGEIASKMKISRPEAFKLYRKALRWLTNSPYVKASSSGG